MTGRMSWCLVSWCLAFWCLVSCVPALPLIVFPVIVCSAACAAEPPDPVQEARFDLMRETAARYVVTVQTASGAETAQMQPEPLLRWTNPLRNTADGAVFLWTQAGRPTAMLCTYPHAAALDHEWQSLAETPLRATYPAGKDWAPAQAGVVFTRLPEAGTPAGSAALRLTQMRRMVGKFTASVHPAPRTSELRLLTQPIYRTPAGTPGQIDGAIFAFVQGTDPELLVLFEGRQDATGTHWYYALARMSGNVLACQHQGETVAELPGVWPGKADGPYMTFLKRVPMPFTSTEAAE